MWITNILLLLALGYHAVSARMVIGYRTVSEEEATEINRKNAPFRDPDYDDSEGWSQLGNGVYTTPTPAGWSSYGVSNWYCAIKADEDKFTAATKAWIPYADYYDNRLWNQGESALTGYISDSLNEEPDKTLRLSYIGGHGYNEQMLIPTEMVNSDALDFYAQCFGTKQELLDYSDEVVDYDSWSNLVGYKGNPRK
ncbi:hypothetical protein BDP67DRAFT_568748 [Colletotrichum lupini]|nr:hypothetical protein BDP67DRAFT_568748 [Colletotrichum lupini]